MENVWARPGFPLHLPAAKNASKDIHDHVEMSIQAGETCLKMTKYLCILGVDDDKYHIDEGHTASGSPAQNCNLYCISILERSIATTLPNLCCFTSASYITPR